MIRPADVREWLRWAIAGALPDAHVYERGVRDGQLELPAVVVGEFETTSIYQPSGCSDMFELSVAVVWHRTGMDDEGMQAALEDAWVQLQTELRALADEDPYMGDADVGQWRPVRSEFGEFAVRSGKFPCHIITLEISG